MPLGGIIPSQPPGGERLRRTKKRRQGRDGEDAPGAVTRPADQAELTSTPDVLSSERTRQVSENDSEDAHEDHLLHPNYVPRGDRSSKPGVRRLNLEG